MDNVSFFIQARTSATRLPQKLLKTFGRNKTILQIIIERLHSAFPDNKIYILTTSSVNDDLLVDSIINYPVEVFRGDEKDVLDRFIKAGDFFGEEHILRICADNPFIDIEYIGRLLKQSMEGVDYLSYSVKGHPVIKCHYGIFSERTKISSLKKILTYTSDSFFKEHVTNFLYGHPDIFNCRFIEISGEMIDFENIRLTVDTMNDFCTTSIIFERLKDYRFFKKEELIHIIEQNPELKEIMIKEIQENTK